MKPSEVKSMDEYIAMFPETMKTVLRQLRTTIRESAPQAREAISYQMPLSS